jgi:hypothetical protein
MNWRRIQVILTEVVFAPSFSGHGPIVRNQSADKLKELSQRDVLYVCKFTTDIINAKYGDKAIILPGISSLLSWILRNSEHTNDLSMEKFWNSLSKPLKQEALRMVFVLFTDDSPEIQATPPGIWQLAQSAVLRESGDYSIIAQRVLDILKKKHLI